MLPTRAGPAAPPKSPDMASMAKRAVPPLGILGEQMLIVPGHIIPTENPDSSVKKVVFNVFGNKDLEIYKKVFAKQSNGGLIPT